MRDVLSVFETLASLGVIAETVTDIGVSVAMPLAVDWTEAEGVGLRARGELGGGAVGGTGVGLGFITATAGFAVLGVPKSWTTKNP